LEAITTATVWLSEHLKSSPQVKLLFVSDSVEAISSIADAQKKKGLDNLIILSSREYIFQKKKTSTSLRELYESLAQLGDVVQEDETEQTTFTRKKSDVTHYEEYLPDDILEAGVKSSTYFRGTLNVNSGNPDEAFIRLEDPDRKPVLIGNFGTLKDIFIPGKELRNRAIHGDTVAVELLPEKDWISPSAVLRVTDEEEERAEYPP
jgi:exoribonuclease R